MIFPLLVATMPWVAGCGVAPPARAALGLEGDTCQATADCEAPLSCVSNMCGTPGGRTPPPRGEGEGEGEGAPPPPPPFVHFVEIGEAAGVRKDPSHGAVGVLDWDGDGRPDLFVTEPQSSYSLFRSLGDGTYEDVAVAAGLKDLPTVGGYGALVADYDNDGDQDVFITRDGFGDPSPNSLLRNEGGVFSDVAGPAGVTGADRTIGAAFLDYDNDGQLDLYVVNGLRQGAPNTLYRNRGDGTFEDATVAAGVGHPGKGFQVVAGDYDGDRDSDLYVVNREGPNVLYRNDGSGTFTDVTQTAGVGAPDHAIGALFVDYDGDDDLDLFVAPENEWDAVNAWETGRLLGSAVAPRLYQNQGDGTFLDVATAAGIVGVYAGRSVIESDCDNDGWVDIVVGAGSPGPGPALWNLVYRNRGDGTFSDEAIRAGVGPTAMTHGMTIADLDGDGFEDIYLIPGHSTSLDAPHGNALYRNEGNDNHWLKVRLIGTRSNRDGIGARVLLRTGDHLQVREVRGGQPFAGTRDRVVVFGLKQHAAADSLEVRWPSGQDSRRTSGLVAGALVDMEEPR